MAPKNQKRKSNYARKSLQSDTARATITEVPVIVVSAQQKKSFLKPFVDDLVHRKLIKKQRLNADSYTATLNNIKAVGVNWVSLDSLKSKVKRAYALAIENQPSPNTISNSRCISTTPPPPGAIPSDTSRSTQPHHIRKKAGRPNGTTNVNKIIIANCVTEARNEITDLYYAEYLKAKQSSTKTNRVTLQIYQERVSKGTYKKCMIMSRIFAICLPHLIFLMILVKNGSTEDYSIQQLDLEKISLHCMILNSI